MSFVRVVASAAEGVPGIKMLARENPSGTNKYGRVEIMFMVALFVALS
mgnify:CR=1 FL=1